jgi:predicted TPR repeat methyltransferase
MLDRAAQRARYDTLIQQDAVELMRRTPQTFAMIAAGDVFAHEAEIRTALDAALPSFRSGGVLFLVPGTCCITPDGFDEHHADSRWRGRRPVSRCRGW